MLTMLLDVTGDDPGFDAAWVEFHLEYVRRIAELKIAVQALDVCEIQTFAYDVTPINIEAGTGVDGRDLVLEASDMQLECVTMNVTPTGVYWSGCYENSDRRWRTAELLHRQLAEMKEGHFDLREKG